MVAVGSSDQNYLYIEIQFKRKIVLVHNPFQEPNKRRAASFILGFSMGGNLKGGPENVMNQ